MDVICQAKSGMGKTAVFVLTTLQQLDLTQSGDVLVVVLCHTRELAFQIQNEYDRFSKYMPEVRETEIQKEIADANTLASPCHAACTGHRMEFPLRPPEATGCWVDRRRPLLTRCCLLSVVSVLNSVQVRGVLRRRPDQAAQGAPEDGATALRGGHPRPDPAAYSRGRPQARQGQALRPR